MSATSGISKSGDCCDVCEKNYDPCNCGAAAITLECRTKSTGFEIKGFIPYLASNPPKRYKTFTPAGTLTIKNYSGPDCAGTPSTTVLEYSGSCVYDPDQNTFTSFAKVQQTLPNGDVSNGYAFCSPISGGLPEETWIVGNILSATQSKLAETGLCVYNGNDTSTIREGTTTGTLTNEDTENAAIRRSAKKASWSAWAGTAVGQCCSFISKRGSGQLTGTFRSAQLKIKVKGSVNAKVKIRVVWVQTPLDGKGQIESRTDEVTIYCDGSGEGEEVLSVPEASGKQTCAADVGIIA